MSAATATMTAIRRQRDWRTTIAETDSSGPSRPASLDRHSLIGLY
jgi:hypothetical protein